MIMSEVSKYNGFKITEKYVCTHVYYVYKYTCIEERLSCHCHSIFHVNMSLLMSYCYPVVELPVVYYIIIPMLYCASIGMCSNC